MNQSNLETPIVPYQKSNKLLLTIIISILATALVVGLVVYFVMAKISNDKQGELKEQIKTLQQQINQLTGQAPIQEPDSDNDGLSDSQELELGTDPHNPDTDSDGYLDGSEVANGYDPLIDEKKEQPQELQDEFTNWQTYRNEEYRFEFKYPSSWITVDGKKCNFFELLLIPEDRYTTAYYSSPYISIRVEGNPRGLTLKEYLNKNYYPFKGHINTLEVIRNKNIEQVQSDAALERNAGYVDDCGTLALIDTDQFIIQDGNYVVFITNGFYAEEDQKYKRIFNQVFSTFRFLDEKADF